MNKHYVEGVENGKMAYLTRVNNIAIGLHRSLDNVPIIQRGLKWVSWTIM